MLGAKQQGRLDSFFKPTGVVSSSKTGSSKAADTKGKGGAKRKVGPDRMAAMEGNMILIDSKLDHREMKRRSLARRRPRARSERRDDMAGFVVHRRTIVDPIHPRGVSSMSGCVNSL